jgi:hypothetical protein
MTSPPDDRAARELADGDAPEDDDSGPCRRCIVSGEVKPVEELIRFGIDPDDGIVPDVESRLPGRGIWLSADRDMVNTAVAKNLFSKAARRKVKVPTDLADRIETLLSRRCLDLVGLARRAGQAVAGFDKVREELKSGRGALVLAAADGAQDGRDKIAALASGKPVVAVLRNDELAAAFGRDRLVHVVLAPGRLTERLTIETRRLAGFRKL